MKLQTSVLIVAGLVALWMVQRRWDNAAAASGDAIVNAATGGVRG